MKNFKALVLMQLKDKIDTSCFKSVKATIFKVVLWLVKFVAVTAIIYFAFSLLSFLRLVALIDGIPQNFFSVVFTIMYILSIIFCTVGLMKNLYQTRDNALLLTFPCNRTMVFTSKLVVYFIYELLRNLTYLMPIFIAYGLINGLPFYFYIWLVFAYLIVTAIPVVVGGLLSIPLMYIVNFVKKYKWLEISILSIFGVGVVTCLILLIGAIPPNINIVGTWGTTYWEIQNFLTKFNSIFVPFSYLAIKVVGQRYGVTNELFTAKQWFALLGAIATILLVIGLIYLLVRPLYFKMASASFEYKKSHVKRIPNIKRHNSFVSVVKKELITDVRSSEKLYGIIFVLIGMPLAIYLLNQIYSAMDTRLSGANMVIAFNIMLISLMALSSSVAYSHIYSEEGASSYLQKTNPKPYIFGLFAKLVIPMVTTTIAILTSTIIFVCFVGYNAWQATLIFVLIELVYVGHLLWSAELDIMNPQTQQYKTTGTHVNNPNEIRSTLYALLMSALIAFLTYFFISESLQTVWYKVLIVAVAFFAMRLWLYINKIKVYYKEK